MIGIAVDNRRRRHLLDRSLRLTTGGLAERVDRDAYPRAAIANLRWFRSHMPERQQPLLPCTEAQACEALVCVAKACQSVLWLEPTVDKFPVPKSFSSATIPSPPRTTCYKA
jgi:hypothetical protein